VGRGASQAEHDQVAAKTFWFSVNTWSWRGLVEFSRFLDDSVAIHDDETRVKANKVVASLEEALAKATAISLVNDGEGKPYFIPPYVAANFPPYTSMIASSGPLQNYGGGSSYANFRYFSEMLSSGYFSEEVETALSDFRWVLGGFWAGFGQELGRYRVGFGWVLCGFRVVLGGVRWGLMGFRWVFGGLADIHTS
jgi:hypothetical protein